MVSCFEALQGDEADMFVCPFPGCNRKFYELARLKEHYRAPPDRVKKAKGHGKELPACPKCGESLEKGKRHFACDTERKGWDPVGGGAPRGAAALMLGGRRLLRVLPLLGGRGGSWERHWS